MPFDIRTATCNAIERTQDPMASIKMQSAHSSVNQLGKMFTVLTTAQETQEVAAKLMAGFTDAELDKPNAALIIALSSMLSEALVIMGHSFANDPSI